MESLNNFDHYMDKNSLRPLSPHLTIHKKMQTAVLSIFHRITGILLSIGSIMIVMLLVFIALGQQYYDYLYMVDLVTSVQ